MNGENLLRLGVNQPVVGFCWIRNDDRSLTGIDQDLVFAVSQTERAPEGERRQGARVACPAVMEFHNNSLEGASK